jgi:hypothetical protein
MKFRKHSLSVLAIVAFFFIAIASKVNKIHGNAFSTNVGIEEADERNYVVLHDGSRVIGSEIKKKSPLFGKTSIIIDDQKFPVKDVRGYMSEGMYWKNHGSHGFMRRLVHGKLNVYQETYQVSETSTSTNGMMRTTSRTRYRHYVERGENGPLTLIANQKDIRKAVEGCPLAVEMANLPDRKIRRAIRANSHYLNEIFEIYNNDCKPIHE